MKLSEIFGSKKTSNTSTTDHTKIAQNQALYGPRPPPQWGKRNSSEVTGANHGKSQPASNSNENNPDQDEQIPSAFKHLYQGQGNSTEIPISTEKETKPAASKIPPPIEVDARPRSDTASTMTPVDATAFHKKIRAARRSLKPPPKPKVNPLIEKLQDAKKKLRVPGEHNVRDGLLDWVIEDIMEASTQQANSQNIPVPQNSGRSSLSRKNTLPPLPGGDYEPPNQALHSPPSSIKSSLSRKNTLPPLPAFEEDGAQNQEKEAKMAADKGRRHGKSDANTASLDGVKYSKIPVDSKLLESSDVIGSKIPVNIQNAGKAKEMESEMNQSSQLGNEKPEELTHTESFVSDSRVSLENFVREDMAWLFTGVSVPLHVDGAGNSLNAKKQEESNAKSVKDASEEGKENNEHDEPLLPNEKEEKASKKEELTEINESSTGSSKYARVKEGLHGTRPIPDSFHRSHENSLRIGAARNHENRLDEGPTQLVDDSILDFVEKISNDKNSLRIGAARDYDDRLDEGQTQLIDDSILDFVNKISNDKNSLRIGAARDYEDRLDEGQTQFVDDSILGFVEKISSDKKLAMGGSKQVEYNDENAIQEIISATSSSHSKSPKGNPVRRNSQPKSEENSGGIKVTFVPHRRNSAVAQSAKPRPHSNSSDNIEEIINLSGNRAKKEFQQMQEPSFKQPTAQANFPQENQWDSKPAQVHSHSPPKQTASPPNRPYYTQPSQMQFPQHPSQFPANQNAPSGKQQNIYPQQASKIPYTISEAPASEHHAFSFPQHTTGFPATSGSSAGSVPPSSGINARPEPGRPPVGYAHSSIAFPQASIGQYPPSTQRPNYAQTAINFPQTYNAIGKQPAAQSQSVVGSPHSVSSTGGGSQQTGYPQFPAAQPHSVVGSPHNAGNFGNGKQQTGYPQFPAAQPHSVVGSPHNAGNSGGGKHQTGYPQFPAAQPHSVVGSPHNAGSFGNGKQQTGYPQFPAAQPHSVVGSPHNAGNSSGGKQQTGYPQFPAAQPHSVVGSPHNAGNFGGGKQQTGYPQFPAAQSQSVVGFPHSAGGGKQQTGYSQFPAAHPTGYASTAIGAPMSSNAHFMHNYGAGARPTQQVQTPPYAPASGYFPQVPNSHIPGSVQSGPQSSSHADSATSASLSNKAEQPIAGNPPNDKPSPDKPQNMEGPNPGQPNPENIQHNLKPFAVQPQKQVQPPFEMMQMPMPWDMSSWSNQSSGPTGPILPPPVSNFGAETSYGSPSYSSTSQILPPPAANYSKIPYSSQPSGSTEKPAAQGTAKTQNQAQKPIDNQTSSQPQKVAAQEKPKLEEKMGSKIPQLAEQPVANLPPGKHQAPPKVQPQPQSQPQIQVQAQANVPPQNPAKVQAQRLDSLPMETTGMLLEEQRRKHQKSPSVVSASLALTSDSNIFARYRENARRSNNPDVQREFAKYLLSTAEVYAVDPSKKGEHGSQGRIVAMTQQRQEMIQEAEHWIETLCQSGDSESQYIKGTWFEDGLLGKPVDLEEAFKCYMPASRGSYAPASYKVGVIYEKKGKASQAVEYYKRAAGMGDAAACHRLGQAFLIGELRLSKSEGQGLKYLSKSAATVSRVHPQGALLYAQLLGGLHPKLTIQRSNHNSKEAMRLLSHVAELGYAPAQTELGRCYDQGLLEYKRSPQESISWYRRAAEQGDAEALLALSIWCAKGASGVFEKDERAAFEWCKKAVEKGLPAAEYTFGNYHEQGIGVRKDMEVAKLWWEQAAAKGNTLAVKKLHKKKPAAGKPTKNSDCKMQ